METSNSNTQQRVRDTRRVLQVLLPGLPPPAIEMACNTFFASSTLGQQKGSSSRSPAGRYKLRRMDSGDFGELSLTSPPTKPQAKHFSDGSKLVFDGDFSTPDMKSSKKSKR